MKTVELTPQEIKLILELFENDPVLLSKYYQTVKNALINKLTN